MVNVYGMRPLNLTLDLCSVFSGALCPLPTYNFTGSDSITLPSAIVGQVSSRIPGIAYKIPDLEAYAQLTLTDINTGKQRACLQSTLTNGWSARQRAVEWSTGAIALLSFFSAVWHSYIPLALAPIRFLDVLFLLQAIAISGLWSLNYPLVYQAFTQNFSWALGLFPVSTNSPMQSSIDRMRSLTGGTLEGSDGGSAISLVNRKNSPYNDVSARSLIARAFEVATRSDEVPSTNATTNPNSLLVGGDVATVTQTSDNVLQAGLPIYVTSVGVDTANAFMTVFLLSLIIIAIALATLALGYGILLGLRRTSWGEERRHKLDSAITAYPEYAKAWGLRLILIALAPILVFTFYQWTLKDSWLSIFLSVILLLATLGALGFTTFTFYRRRADPDIQTHHTIIEPLVAPYRPQRSYYGFVVLLAVFVKSLVTAFAKGRGMVQAILVLVVEIFFFVLLCIMKPHRTRGADILSGYLSLTRIVCTGLTIAFAQSLALAAIPRVVIGIVIAVIFSVAVVVMFFNLFFNLCIWLFGTRTDGHGSTTVLGSSTSSMEKDRTDNKDEEKVVTANITPASSTHFYPRPSNPAPSHTPTTASWLTPPLSAVTHSTSSEHPSQFSEHPSTGSSTLGEIGETLPRRWSFQHSRPPSTSVDSHAISHLTTPTSPSSMYVTPRHSRQTSGVPSPTDHRQSQSQEA